MLHRRANLLGLVAVAIAIVVSLAIGYLYGQQVAETWIQGVLYSSIGVAAVLVEAAGLHRCDTLWRAGRVSAALMCACVLTISSATTILYEIGFVAGLLEGKASTGETRSSERATLDAERRDLMARIERTGQVRLPEAIQAEIDAKAALKALAADARAAAQAETIERKGCGDRCKAHEARAAGYMADYDKPPSAAELTGELGIANATAVARARVIVINNQLHGLADAKVADARASLVARLFGTTEDAARMGIALGIVLFLFMLRTIGPYIFIDSAAMAAMAAAMGQKKSAEGAPKPILAAEEAAERPAARLNGSAALPYHAAVDAEDFGEIEVDDDEGDGVSAEDMVALFEMESSREAEAALLADIQAEQQVLPPPFFEDDEPSLDARGRQVRQLVQGFVDDCLNVRPRDSSAKEGAQQMQDCFQLWLGEHHAGVSISKMEFGEHMKTLLVRMGGEFKKIGSRYYFGVTIKPSWAKRLADEADPVEDKKQLTAGRRLGGVIRRRGDLDGEPAGTA